jgi:hypothetical protein
MATKAILLNTLDFTDRPKDPAPIAVLLHEMKEYCKRNNYTVIAEVNSQQKFIYEKNTPLAKLILENSTGADDIVIVKLGKNYEQVEGDTIDPELTRLVSENRLRTEQIEHPCVAPPKDGNTRIWRYLNLPKFVDLLQSSSLHFTRVDEMRKYDASEGVSSTLAMKRLIQQVAENKIESPIPELTREQFLRIFNSSQSDDLLNRVHFINCWHMSEHENFAMWKVYSEPFGVCIESRYDDLKNSFVDQKWDYYANKHKIYIGKVEYIDSETQFIRRDNSFWTYLSKRREYSYENELRCVVTEWDQPSFARPKVDLSRLIRKIRLNPEAPSWYHATVVDLCQRYGFNPSAIVPSALSEN